MASLLLRRRSSSALLHLSLTKYPSSSSSRLFSSSSSSALPSGTSEPSSTPNPTSKPPSLSARLSFVFDQLDSLDRSRSDSSLSSRDAALRRIQSWRHTQTQQTPNPLPSASPPPPPPPQEDHNGDDTDNANKENSMIMFDKAVSDMSMEEVLRKEVEVVHPWPEWIELMERLAQQKYFDLRRVDEDRLAAEVPIDLSEVREEVGLDFSRDWITVKNAIMNFGRDRFDILKYVR